MRRESFPALDSKESIRDELARVYHLHKTGELDAHEMADCRRHLEAMARLLDSEQPANNVVVYIPDNQRCPELTEELQAAHSVKA